MKTLSFGPNGKPKLELPADFAQLLKDHGLKEISLHSEDAGELSKFLLLHKHDPMDRMLMAQASRNGMKFLTADRVLLSLDIDWVLDTQD